MDGGPEPVRSVGDRVRRAPRRASREAIALGLDAFLTGEPAEHVMADARETGDPLHRGAATTRRRPSASGGSASWWRTDFGIEHRFVEIPNPI